MSKKDKFETIEVEDVNLLPDLLDGNHRVIPIVTGGDEVVEEVEVPEIIPILTLRSSVLFPGAITPITGGPRQERSGWCAPWNAEGGLLGAVAAARKRRSKTPPPDDMYTCWHRGAHHQGARDAQRQPHGDPDTAWRRSRSAEYITTEPYFRGPRHRRCATAAPDLKQRRVRSAGGLDQATWRSISSTSRRAMPKEAAFAIKNIDSKRGIINFICSNIELTDEPTASRCWRPRACWPRARKLLEILIREQQLARAEKPDSGCA